MHQLRSLIASLRASFWFIPYVIVSVLIVLAVALTHVVHDEVDSWISDFPHIFETSAAGAREMLSTIAGSMISVVGVVFSMTLVALALASSQYSSRVLRTFMRSRLTQVCIGLFAGVFVYCVIVLRGVHGSDDDVVVPVAAVTLAIVLAVASVLMLIYFIHHIALSIQASTILSSVAAETIATVKHMYPLDPNEVPREAEDELAAAAAESGEGQAVFATTSGYIQSMDEGALLDFASEHDTLVRMELGVGQFFIADTCLLTLKGGSGFSEKVLDELRRAIKISPYRTIEQDPTFGIRQIVDVALKALSPSMNDTTTAVMCVDYLGTILAVLAPRSFPPRCRRVHGSLRVLTVSPDFAALVGEAFDQIRRSAGGNVSVMLRIIGTIEVIGSLAQVPDRFRALSEQLDFLEELSERTVAAAPDREMIKRRLGQVRTTLSDGYGRERRASSPPGKESVAS